MNAVAERLDWHANKDRIDIATVATALLGEPPGRNGNRGLWWSCPFHADRNPSLNVDPNRRRWKCWGCGEHGDAVELAIKLNPSMAFPEAVRHVAELSGIIPMSGGTRKVVQRFAPSATAAVRPVAKPSGLPLETALNLVADSAERLWTPQGSEALAYLHDRGLTDETIRSARLGYVRDAAIPTRDGDRTYRASGVVIPWHDGDRLASVKIRQPEGRKPKYAEAYRDRPRVFPGPAAIRPGFRLVVVEGEFDALLLAQQIGDTACVVTLGSASNHTADDIRRAARACPSLFTAHDADDAGDKAAAKWPARAIRVRPPDGCKDWSEAHATGFNRIRYLWGRYLPLGNPPKDEDFAPCVAGLSDDEPDWYATAEREAIQADSRTVSRENPHVGT